jgi:hypothetical protein
MIQFVKTRMDNKTRRLLRPIKTISHSRRLHGTETYISGTEPRIHVPYIREGKKSELLIRMNIDDLAPKGEEDLRFVFL